MRRRSILTLLYALGTTAVPAIVGAQPAKKLWRIGAVWAGTEATSKPFAGALLEGMRDRGYEIGRDLIVDMRYADGNPSRYGELVENVIALRPDILMGASTGIAVEMKRRTATIPIVTATTSDPVISGLVQSLARPGGNVTGMSTQIHELGAKHVELMLELQPRIRSVAILSDLANEGPLNDRYEQTATAVVATHGMSVDLHRIDDHDNLQAFFRKLPAQRVDALLINPSPRLNRLRREIARHAEELRLPSISFTGDYPRDGGLMSYGPSFIEASRRAAYFIDRILNGVKPGELPVERPTVFLLTINLKTARALGLSVPATLLDRANEVIE